MDILDLLKASGVEIAEDKRGEFEKEFRKGYKSVQELNKIKSELSEKVKVVEDLELRLEEQGKSVVGYDELKEKYEKYVARLNQQIAETGLNTRLEKALNGLEFASTRVRDSVLADIKAQGFKEDTDGNLEGLNDFLKGLYEKEPETFKGVDTEIHTWGATNQTAETETKPNIFGQIL